MKKAIPLIIFFILITVTAFVYKESKDIRLERATEMFSINIPDDAKIISYEDADNIYSIKISIPAGSIKTFTNSLSGYEAYSQDFRYPYESVSYGFYNFGYMQDELFLRNIYIFEEQDNRIEIYMERCIHSLR